VTYTITKYKREQYSTPRAIYDFRIDKDGQLFGFFSKVDRGYLLTDPFHESVREPHQDGRLPPRAVFARKQDDFLAVLEKYGSQVPTVDECRARRQEKQERLRKAQEEEARDRQARPELYR
jgi:hypothetical protein